MGQGDVKSHCIEGCKRRQTAKPLDRRRRRSGYFPTRPHPLDLPLSLSHPWRLDRMKRSVVALLCLAVCLAIGATLPSTPAQAAPNLLKNAGFEQPLEGHPWMPAVWDTSISGLSSVFFGRDTLSPHGGEYSISVANVSASLPMAHNWSQTLLVGSEAWNKELVFTVWTRNVGLEGRAYILLQAYRDTITKMARTWKVERDEAATRLGIHKVDDPLLDFGWERQYFSETETGWVRRQVRVFVAPSTNVVFVRMGITGTGQVAFDDASLTLEPATSKGPIATNTNLLP